MHVLRYAFVYEGIYQFFSKLYDRDMLLAESDELPNNVDIKLEKRLLRFEVAF